MIRLHLLGFTPDLKGLVFSGRRGGKSGTYWVPVDAAFQKALTQLESAREDEAREKDAPKKKAGEKGRTRDVSSFFEDAPAADAAQIETSRGLAAADTEDIPVPQSGPRVQSSLSPKEIQALLREGKSVPDVASRAGVEPSWVERFVGPVLEEKAGVIRRTQDAIQSRPRLGPSGLPIGLAVYRNLEDRKATTETLDEIEEGWDARRVRSRTWRVRLRFTHRGKKRSAEWEYRKDSGAIKPRNKLANDLGWWPPTEDQREERATSRSPAPAVEDDEADPATGESQSSANRSGGGRAKKAAKRSTRKGSSRKKPARRKPAPKRSASKKRSTSKRKPATRKKTSAKKKPAGRKKTSAKKKPASRKKTSAKKKPASRKKTPAKKKPASRKKTPSKRSSSRKSSTRRGSSTRRR